MRAEAGEPRKSKTLHGAQVARPGHFQAQARQLTSSAADAWCVGNLKGHSPSVVRAFPPFNFANSCDRSVPMTDSSHASPSAGGFRKAAQAIVVTSVMFSFISYW